MRLERCGVGDRPGRRLHLRGVRVACDSMDEQLRDEILRRRDVDQEARMRAIELTRGMKPGARPSAEARESMRRMQAIDRENTAWLRQVVREHGWPKRSRVGDDAASAAWLLVQHSDLDLAFQRECRRLLGDAVGAGEASASDLAYLTDRILRAEGRPQRYGTQLAPSADGGYEPQPLEDPARVDELRATVGLGSLEEYARQLRDVYGPEKG